MQLKITYMSMINKKINWWFMLAFAIFSAVVYSIDGIKIWQAFILINLFIGADLIGSPTKRVLDEKS